MDPDVFGEVRLEGFEPPTLGSEDRCSNPLSYSRKKSLGDSTQPARATKVKVYCIEELTEAPTPV